MFASFTRMAVFTEYLLSQETKFEAITAFERVSYSRRADVLTLGRISGCLAFAPGLDLGLVICINPSTHYTYSNLALCSPMTAWQRADVVAPGRTTYH